MFGLLIKGSVAVKEEETGKAVEVGNNLSMEFCGSGNCELSLKLIQIKIIK